MNLAERGYALLALTAALAIAGLWSSDATLAQLWQWPLLVVLLALLGEAWLAPRTPLRVALETSARHLLGRSAPAQLQFRNDGRWRLQIEFVPVVPSGFQPLGAPRRLAVDSASQRNASFDLLGTRLGRHRWPAVPGRVLGRFGLAWWSTEWQLDSELEVAPDLVRAVERRARGASQGHRSRRAAGAGHELLQLRAYAPGDPLARIDWKATARRSAPVVREFSEDQHLEVLLLLDAGRLSRIRGGALDRLGLFANIAARFAQSAVLRDDRIGVIVYADRILAECAPQRGAGAVLRVRELLTRLPAPASGESDPLAAALRARRVLQRRALIVMLTDLEDATTSAQLLRAVRLLAPPHLVLMAGVRGEHIEALARREAVGWRDPWNALAAEEQLLRIESQQRLLRQAGVPVVVARHELLEAAVLREYQSLRSRRRV